MSDIKFTAGDDTYIQPESEKDRWNNYFGLDGNDTFKVYQGAVLGGAGNDRIEIIPTSQWWRGVQAAYWDAPAGVKADLAAGTADDGWGGHDTLVGVESVWGSAYDDVLLGDAVDNLIGPNNGNDSVDGRGGTDTVAMPWFEPAPGATWRAVRIDDLAIQVSPDGIHATVTPRIGKGFAYTLSNVEKIQVNVGQDATGNDINQTYDLADFILPQDMAEQAIAAGPSLRWNASAALGTPVALTYSFVTLAPASGVGATGFRAFSPAEQQAVRDILAHTAALTGLSFTEVMESGGAVGQLRFGVSEQAATKGVSWLPGEAGAGDQAGDVWMDADSMLQLQPGTEGCEALLHEIGHALGLRHPRNVDAGDHWAMQLRPQDDITALTVMSESASADGLFRSEWGALDLLALRYLYGSKPASTGNDVYTLGPRESNSQTTLTDDGGVDTLDASALPAGVNLDLVPGHLSSAGLSGAGAAAVNNLAIPAGTWIENAVGTAFDDVLIGNALDNRLTGGLGNDWIDGGAGNDVALFDGLRADFEVSSSYGKVYVRARDGSAGFDTLTRMERLHFTDRDVALDMGVNEHGGQTAQVLRALLGAATLKVAAYAGYGVVLLDQGMSYAALVDMAVHTDVFWSLAGDPQGHSNAAFVRAVYRNVTGADASPAQLQNYVSLLDHGTYTQSSLALLACQTDINVHGPELVGLAGTGLDYIVPPGLG